MTTEWGLSIKMMPHIKMVMGEIPSRCFFEIADAPIERDLKEATDLVMKLTGGDIAIRVRQHAYIYPWWSKRKDTDPLAFDWSIRWAGKGPRTEIHKLREGFAWRYFFAMATPDENGLARSCLIDMDRVRSLGILNKKDGWVINDNKHDHTTGGYFKARRLLDLGCILWYSGQ